MLLKEGTILVCTKDTMGYFSEGNEYIVEDKHIKTDRMGTKYLAIFDSGNSGKLIGSKSEFRIK